MNVMPIDDNRHQIVGTAVKHAEADDLARRQSEALDRKLGANRILRSFGLVIVGLLEERFAV
jgi:hypothetical protein